MTRAVDRVLGARLPDPPGALRRGPLREDAFPSPLHTERRASRVGVWLGAGFVVCFLTGLVSHLIQDPPGWFVWPAGPVWLYRVTQGTHVAVGLALIPLLLVKLWTVYPKLFSWPPAATPAKAVGRISILVLVGSSMFMLITGLVNISQWYPFGFGFRSAHYWTGWVAVGAVLTHVGSYAPQIRRGLARRGTPAAVAGLAPEEADRVHDETDAEETGPVSRRAFVAAAVATTGAVALTQWGQTVSPLAQVSVLSPRIPGYGPQDLPVNQTAEGAGVTETAVDPAYRLVVEGPTPLELTLADLQAFPQYTERLPIACVEGWSSNADWTGPRLRDVLAAAGLPRGAVVHVESIQTGGSYRVSTVSKPHSASEKTLLALRLNGEELHVDHGYPVRLIAPNRPGAMQTKWLGRIAPGAAGVGS
ncbi:molybdopterin-dependent oxidoreductase [Klenkia sp. PcliD-1-E]|uniref:molybdopterin-dependent oxidoreductase n=1 Tax=Klenkia sp. PcliD-1-E TaxID=2954492 RepID=UPI002096914F|nr:molybdopterin-dependent oxidoreductase [Klenkia sp. PcliD-1-E]MCO7219333.1 molybdopterin-dependent oxidoreductase [Klenkia sp. PcliD-1-E]